MESPEPGQPNWASLLAVPSVVARQLKNEPLLLTCIGVATLLALIGIFGPNGAALYAWLLAALAVFFGALWAVLIHRWGEGGRRPDSAVRRVPVRDHGRSNEVEVADRAEFGRVDMRAAGGNVLRGGKKTRIESLDMRAGLPAEPDPGPPDRSPRS